MLKATSAPVAFGHSEDIEQLRQAVADFASREIAPARRPDRP